jgi:hypothetical protein
MIHAPLDEIIEMFDTHLVASGPGLSDWTMTQSLGSFDEVDSLLAHQHEYDHADLLSSTPIGVLLAKLHLFQFGRMTYLIATLKDRSSRRTPEVRPPFTTWFRHAVSSELNLDPVTMTYDQVTGVDESLGLPFAIGMEIDSYRLAEWTLTSSAAERPTADVVNLNEALRNVAGFQEVPHGRPLIVEGDGSLTTLATDTRLTGEAIIEGHALLLELLVLRGGHADEALRQDWWTHRVRTPATELSPGVRVLDMIAKSNELSAWPLSIGLARLLLELALMAPLEPATWGQEVLPLDAVHPGLRLLRLLYAVSQGPPVTAEMLDAPAIDALFEGLGWPSVSELQHRADTQLARARGLAEMARQQYETLGRSSSWDLDMTGMADRGLRAGLALRRANPSLRALGRGTYLTVVPLEYYSDGVMAAEGLGTTTMARHEHLMESLLGAWLLHDDETLFRMAARANYSMARSARMQAQARSGSTLGSPSAPQLPTPETILSEIFLAAR